MLCIHRLWHIWETKEEVTTRNTWNFTNALNIFTTLESLYSLGKAEARATYRIIVLGVVFAVVVEFAWALD